MIRGQFKKKIDREIKKNENTYRERGLEDGSAQVHKKRALLPKKFPWRARRHT